MEAPPAGQGSPPVWKKQSPGRYVTWGGLLGRTRRGRVDSGGPDRRRARNTARMGLRHDALTRRRWTALPVPARLRAAPGLTDPWRGSPDARVQAHWFPQPNRRRSRSGRPRQDRPPRVPIIGNVVPHLATNTLLIRTSVLATVPAVAGTPTAEKILFIGELAGPATGTRADGSTARSEPSTPNVNVWAV